MLRERDVKRISEVAIPESIPRGKLGGAKTATPGLSLLITPLHKEFYVADQRQANDALFRTGVLFKVLNGFFVVSIGCCALTGISLLAFEWLAIASYTDTTRLIFGRSIPAEGACVALHDVFCVSLLYTMLWMMSEWQPRMVALVWTHAKARVIATLTVTIVYGVGAALLHTSPHHLLWILVRTVCVVYFMFIDALSANYCLRFLPDRFEEIFGSQDKGRGWGTWILFTATLNFGCADVLRHWFVLFASPRRVVVDFNVTNPVTKNVLDIDSHEIADATYFTSMVFVAALLFTFFKTHLGAETVLISTRYAFASVTSRQHSRHAKRGSRGSTVVPEELRVPADSSDAKREDGSLGPAE